MPERYKNKIISIIGLGYIGLPTAAAFASRGVKVIGVDVNKRIVNSINHGQVHIAEPELDMIVHTAVTEGFLRATTVTEPADAFLVAVPTPFKGDYKPDLSYVESSAKSIAPVLKKGDLVILESTSPVGTTEQMAEWLAESRPDLSFPQQMGEDSDIRIAYCPERVLPGRIMRELIENDRVIGGMTPKCSEAAVALYKIFVQGECIITNTRTAEMCKLTENAFRDVNIAFANELSIICDKLNINVWELIKLANRHPRVNILQPGCGVGGHCIAVDPWFIVHKTPDEARLIRTAREVNDSKPHWVIEKVNLAVQELEKSGLNRKDIRIACFGLTFKPDIDDLRESPALKIAEKLYREYGESLMIVEPYTNEPSSSLSCCRFVDVKQALEEAHIIVALVGHRDFRALSTKSVHLNQKVIDLVGILAE